MNTLHLLRKLFVFSFIALNTTFMWASEIDSLRTVLDEEQDKAKKVRILNDLSWAYQNNNIDSALHYANKGLALAEKIENDTLIQGLYSTLGVVEMYLGNYDQAKEVLFKSKQIALLLGLKSNVNIINTNIGIVFAKQSELDSAILYFTQVKDFWEEKGERNRAGRAYANIGQGYSDKGYYIKAIENTLTALQIAEEYNQDKSGYYNSIGISYRQMKEPNQAIEYCKKGLDIALSENNYRVANKCYNTIGLSFNDLKKYEQALEYFKKALDLNFHLKDKRSIGINYSNIGETYQYLSQYDSAMVYAQKSLFLFDSINEKKGLVIGHSNIGLIHMEQNDLEKAYQNFKKAEQLALREDITSELDWVFENLSNLHEKKNNYKDAYDYLLKHQTIKDSLFNETKINRLSEIQELYSTAKDSIKQVEYQLNLANKDKEIAKRNNFFIAAVLGALIALLLAFFQYFRKQKEQKEKELLEVNNELLKEKKLELEHNNAELKVKIEEKSEALKTPQFYAQQQITLSNRDKSTFLLDEISHIKSTGGALVFAVVHNDTKQKEEIWDWSKSLKGLQEDLPDTLFMQVHRSCIVNVLKIQSLKRDVLTLAGNEKIKIGRKYEEKVKSSLKK